MKFTASMLAAVVAGQADFRSGSISTYEKFRYGKFVTRMKAPDQKGTVSSFFLYWDGPNFDPLEWNELDIEIVPSVEENPFSMNIIYGDGHDKIESHDSAQHFDPHDDWHTYEMEWTPHYIAWIVDGHEIRHVNMHDPAVQHLDKAQSLRMNFWTPTFSSWSEGFNPLHMPWYVLYDYVEIFTYDQEHNEFKFHWRDDFDSFDSSKWHKAAGGFESNTSVFHPENVFTSGGMMVLKMEPEHTKEEDFHIRHNIKQAFEMDLDHRKEHGHMNPHLNDFDSESGSEYDEYHRGSDYDDYHRGYYGDQYYPADHRAYLHEYQQYDQPGYHRDQHHDQWPVEEHEHHDDQYFSEDRRLGFVNPQPHHEYDSHGQLSHEDEESHSTFSDYRDVDFDDQYYHHEDLSDHHSHHEDHHPYHEDRHSYHDDHHSYREDHPDHHSYHEDKYDDHHSWHGDDEHHRSFGDHEYGESHQEHDQESTDSQAELEDYLQHHKWKHHRKHHEDLPIYGEEPAYYDDQYQDKHHHGHGKHHDYWQPYEGYDPRGYDDTYYQDKSMRKAEKKREKEISKETRGYGDPYYEEKSERKAEKKQEKEVSKELKRERKYGLEDYGDYWRLKGMLPTETSEQQLMEEARQAQFYRPIRPQPRADPQQTPEKRSQDPQPQPEPSSTPTQKSRQPQPQPLQTGLEQPGQFQHPLQGQPQQTGSEGKQEEAGKFQKAPASDAKKQPEEKKKTDPSQMTYDEFRLWKHEQKMKKRRRDQRQQGRPIPEQEPQFKTYTEYREWKLAQRVRQIEERQAESSQRQYQWEEKSVAPKKKAPPAEETPITAQPTTEKTTFDDSKFQHMATGEKKSQQEQQYFKSKQSDPSSQQKPFDDSQFQHEAKGQSSDPRQQQKSYDDQQYQYEAKAKESDPRSQSKPYDDSQFQHASKGQSSDPRQQQKSYDDQQYKYAAKSKQSDPRPQQRSFDDTQFQHGAKSQKSAPRSQSKSYDDQQYQYSAKSKASDPGSESKSYHDQQFQHQAKGRKSDPRPQSRYKEEPMAQKPEDDDKRFQHRPEGRSSRRKPEQETRQPPQASFTEDFDRPMWQKQKRSSRQDRKRPEPPTPEPKPSLTQKEKRTIDERSIAARTHVFEDQKRRPDSHEGLRSEKSRRQPKDSNPKTDRRRDVPIVRDHDKEYYEEILGDHDQDHHYSSHRRDLFDYDMPLSDSEYDDLDEDTGIYHDQDPTWHPSQHVKHHFSEDQYYHSREHYFPEDSYHAAGQMKYDIETIDDLTQHALGNREIKKMEEKTLEVIPAPVPPTPVAPTPAPAPAPTPVEIAPPVPVPEPKSPAPPAPVEYTPASFEPYSVDREFQHRAGAYHPYQEPQKPLKKKTAAPSPSPKPVQRPQPPSEPKPKAPAQPQPKTEDIRPPSQTPTPTPAPAPRHKQYHRWSPQITRDHHGQGHHYYRYHHDETKTAHQKPQPSTEPRRTFSHEPIHPIIKSEHERDSIPVPAKAAEASPTDQSKDSVSLPKSDSKTHHTEADHRHKLTAKEISDLRVEYGLQYEREHNVDHFIDHLTHPAFEVTGYIDGQHDSQQVMDLFAHDHEEEHYGDEHDELKAHLHLHPKRHQFKPHAISVDHPYYYTGEYREHAEHKEVLPEADDHWVTVRHEQGDLQHYPAKEHHLRRHHDDYRHEDKHLDSHYDTSERYSYHPPKHRDYSDEKVVHEGIYYGEPGHMHHKSSHHRDHHGDGERVFHEDVYPEHAGPHHSFYDRLREYYSGDNAHRTYYNESPHADSVPSHYSEHRVGLHDLSIGDWIDKERGYDHHRREGYNDHGYAFKEELPMHGIYHEREHAGYHPELDHKHDDAHDIKSVKFHEAVIEQAPDLPDHHSYHIGDFPDYHRIEPVHHDHGPIYHGQYQYQRQEWAEPHNYHHSSRKHHQKGSAWRPDLGMHVADEGKKTATAGHWSTQNHDYNYLN